MQCNRCRMHWLRTHNLIYRPTYVSEPPGGSARTLTVMDDVGKPCRFVFISLAQPIGNDVAPVFLHFRHYFSTIRTAQTACAMDKLAFETVHSVQLRNFGPVPPMNRFPVGFYTNVIATDVRSRCAKRKHRPFETLLHALVHIFNKCSVSFLGGTTYEISISTARLHRIRAPPCVCVLISTLFV